MNFDTFYNIVVDNLTGVSLISDEDYEWYWNKLKPEERTQLKSDGLFFKGIKVFRKSDYETKPTREGISSK